MYKKLARCFKIEEIWKDYIHIYQVSNYGRIRNKNTGKVLKTKIKINKNRTNSSPREEVNLSLGSRGNVKTLRVHRIVAEVFIPNPQNLPQINHKDGNSLNNRVDNLEWCTQSENIQHAYDNNLIQ